jgi:hypothetical protein
MLFFFAGYCETYFESFESLCSGIAGDSPMFSMFRQFSAKQKNCQKLKCKNISAGLAKEAGVRGGGLNFENKTPARDYKVSGRHKMRDQLLWNNILLPLLGASSEFVNSEYFSVDYNNQ